MEVDVVIVSESAGSGVAETLRWLGHQTFEGWSATVVEAGPEPAGAREAVDAFNKSAGRERATFIHESSGRGRGVALNEGVAAGSAGAVFLLDAGDMPLKRGLDRLVATLRVGSGGVACGLAAWAEDGKRVGAVEGPGVASFGLLDLLDGVAAEPGAVLFERAVLEGKRFGANLRDRADLDLWLRVSEDGVRWRSCGSVVTLKPRGAARDIEELTSGADEVARVIGRSFARAAARGWDEDDLSDEREARAAARWTLPVATAAALQDTDERLAVATELFRPRASESCVTPEAAAEAAADALTRRSAYPLGFDGTRERAWAAALHRWWSRCVSERWAEPRLGEQAVGLLAERLVANDRVAAAILDTLGVPGKLLVTGADPEAFAMADAAAAKGWHASLVVFEDARTARAIAQASGDRYSVIEAGDASADDPLVVTEHSEGPALERFAARPNVTRWRGKRRELVAEMAGKIRAAWPRRGE